VNALRWLESHEDKLVRGDPKAVAQIKRIHEEGVQVEWLQVSSFIEWQLHVEGAAVQASVQVGAHPLLTYWYCTGALAREGGSSGLRERGRDSSSGLRERERDSSGSETPRFTAWPRSEARAACDVRPHAIHCVMVASGSAVGKDASM
jgi:hypothetical protein